MKISLVILVMFSLIVPSFILGQEKEKIEKGFELTLPISLRKDVLYKPEMMLIKEKLKRPYHYSLGGLFQIQSRYFLLELSSNYEKRQENPPPKREGKIENTLWETEFRAKGKIFKPVAFRVGLGVLSETISPFLYVPRSMAFNSFIPISCRYSEAKIVGGIGLFLGSFNRNYVFLGYSGGLMEQVRHIDNKAIAVQYNCGHSKTTYFSGLSGSLGMRRILNSPFSLVIDADYFRGTNRKETIIKISGELAIRLIKSIELRTKIIKDSNEARESVYCRTGVMIHF